MTFASAQIVPTLSPPVFSTPLYQNPFDFPGSVPLVPPIRTPIAAPTDALSPSSVSGTSNRVDAASTAPSALADIDSLTAPINQREISNEQLTAPRLEQLTAPELKPSTLEDQQLANPKIEQLALPAEGSPSVGAQPLSQIRIVPQVLGSQRINALPPNAVETARSQLARKGAWSMADSRRTAPRLGNPAELPVSRAAALESSTYTKLDPLSPEVLATGPAFGLLPTAEPASAASALRNSTGNSFAFRPKLVTDLHAQPPKHTSASHTAPASKRPGTLSQPLNSPTFARKPTSDLHVPHLGLGIPSAPNR
jgi:hypothetical protein